MSAQVSGRVDEFSDRRGDTYQDEVLVGIAPAIRKLVNAAADLLHIIKRKPEVRSQKPMKFRLLASNANEILITSRIAV